MNIKKLLITSVSVFALAACGANTTTSTQTTTAGAGKTEQTVKVALYGEKNPQWDHLKKVLKEKENITLELQNYTDYVTPNTAVDEGSADINAFQTIGYLEKFNEEKGTKLVSIGYTILQPLGIYSNKIKDVKELKEGDVVIIPNGSSNGGRALRLLQEAGVIKVDPSKGVLPAITDVTENPLKLDIREVDAAQTIRSLDDAAIAIANGDVALDSGKSPKDDAIFLEPITEASKPYYNAIVSNEKDKDKEVLKTIVKYYQTPEVAELIEKEDKGASVPIWNK